MLEMLLPVLGVGLEESLPFVVIEQLSVQLLALLALLSRLELLDVDLLDFS